MGKIITAQEAVAMVRDHTTISTSGFNAFGCPEDLIMTLTDHFDRTGHPKDLRLVKCTSQGDGKGRGISHWAAREGLISELIMSHMGYDPGLRALVAENKVRCYMMPLGNLMLLFRAIAAGLPGAIAKTGLLTFADPRIEGGKSNRITQEQGRDIVSLVELNGEECLFYPSFPIDICFIRATYADEDGNLSMRNETMRVEQFEVAAATRNSGGIVIAQVDRVVKRGVIPAQEVDIHGFMVDYIVQGRPEYSLQSWETDLFRPELTGQVTIPVDDLAPMELDVRKICCRRTAMELTPNSLINLGIGMPGGIGAVAGEEDVAQLFTLSIECGPLGGVPLGGVDFGAAINPEAMYRMADILVMYAGGSLDMGALGFAEIDQFGNVNASSFNGRVVGPGGFIDITQNVKKVCFMGTFLAGKQEISLDGGQLHILKSGTQTKFKEKVGQITFSGEHAQKVGQEVLYITERGVFRLEPEGLTLVEIAPGIDLQKDILDYMEFSPRISPTLKEMDARIFQPEKMGLAKELG